MDDLALLAQSDLFSTLDQDALRLMLTGARTVRCGRNNQLFSEGEEAEELYVVRSGRVAIAKRSSDGRESVLALMESGDLFGEMPLFDGEHRSAHARALENTELLVVPYPPIKSVLEERPELLWEVVALLSRRLRAENARLLRLLRMTPEQAAPPGPGQAAFFEAPPGLVDDGSSPEVKVAFYGALFAARTDVYAIRYDNPRTGRGGWVPAVRGGWRKGMRHEDADFLPLTPGVLAAHLKGEVHIGLYPLLDSDRCWWLAADFDGPDALADALMYVKAARALQVPVALEVSRSGVGAHGWVFFTSPVPAEMARRLGTGLLREAMAMRGRMKLDSYDRLFPSQDLLPAGGIGNLIAAPLFRPARRNGATLFLNLEDLEPYKDQWRYLSTLGRMTPQEVQRAADKAGRVAVAGDVTRLAAPFSSQIRPPAGSRSWDGNSRS